MAQILSEESRKKIGSSLIMKILICDKLSFERDGFKNEDVETKIDFSYSVEKDDDGEYRGTLILNATREAEYVASVQLTGYFSVDENNPDKDALLRKNGMAIIFPYARAQMTLLTAQPEVQPIVLPVVNINKIVEQNNTDSNE